MAKPHRTEAQSHEAVIEGVGGITARKGWAPDRELRERTASEAKSVVPWADARQTRGGQLAVNEERLARGLGWFSIGLGLAEMAAPRSLMKLIGVRGDHDRLLRALGLREIASGVGILTGRGSSVPLAAALWSRVGGDAMDLALLGAAFAAKRSNRGRLAAAMVAVTGVTALDAICSRRFSQRAAGMTGSGGFRVVQAITINRPAEELYRFWRKFDNLPQIMKHIESVRADQGNRSRWVAKGPAGTMVEWEAEIFEDKPGELIAWRSLEGADVDSIGTVRFDRAPAGRGTVVRVNLQYRPPAGVVGKGVAMLFGEDPAWQIRDDLRRFKQVMETGEVITTEGQSAGRQSGTSWLYDGAARG